MRDVEQLWKAGFALGASLDNTVAIGEDKVINPEGLRYGDEFVRHKVLDAIGDLALAGYPIIGEFRSYCGGHRMNVRILEALFADRANYAIVESAAGLSPRRAPFRWLRPRRRPTRRICTEKSQGGAFCLSFARFLSPDAARLRQSCA